MATAADPLTSRDPAGFRIVSWNIMQGGGPRKQRLTDQLVAWNADVAVLTEYRHANGSDFTSMLAKAGLVHQMVGEDITGGYAGSLIASRFPLTRGDVVLDHPDGSARWLHAVIPEIGWNVIACFIPASSGPNGKSRKDAFWGAVIDSANQLSSGPTVITGDFNTGRHFIDEKGKTLHCADRFEAMLDAGWIDGFRSLHGDIAAPTWWSPRYNNGFRLDHALISAGAPIPSACRYETTDANGNTICGPAKGRLSDHAAMLIDLPTARAG